MAQEKYTTGRRKFQHLTKDKRAQIEILLRQGVPKAQIAKAVGIARSTLYEELTRGTVEQLDSELRMHHRYFGDAGQRVYESHRQNSRPPLKLVKAYAFVSWPKHSCWRKSSHPIQSAARHGEAGSSRKPYAPKRFTTTSTSAC